MPRLKGRGGIVGLVWLAAMGVCGQIAVGLWQLPRTRTMLTFFAIGLAGAAVANFVLGRKLPDQ